MFRTFRVAAFVCEGVNDIGMMPSAAALIAVHQQLIERAHTGGRKIFGAMLTPFEGAAYYTAEGEQKRQALNEWIRTSKKYDAVFDFDALVRDPKITGQDAAATRSGPPPPPEPRRV